MCIHCSTPLGSHEYWMEMYRVPVHTRCVGVLSQEMFDRDFLSNLPKWVQETVSNTREQVEGDRGLLCNTAT